MLYTLRFFSSKCSLFHDANLFGSCIIHTLYTGCVRIKKNNSDVKGLNSSLPPSEVLSTKTDEVARYMYRLVSTLKKENTRISSRELSLWVTQNGWESIAFFLFPSLFFDYFEDAQSKVNVILCRTAIVRPPRLRQLQTLT